MTAPERLRISGPEDVLGFIPHSLGYWPAASLVALTMHGRRLGATLRLDLPAGKALASPATYARLVRGYLEADQDADGTLLAFFTGGAVPCDDGAAERYEPLLAALDTALEEAGMPVRDAWYVGERHWRHASCMAGPCCPLPGRPLQEILDSSLNAEMVYRGSSVGPPPEQQPASVRPVPGLQRAAVLEAETAWARELAARHGSTQQLRAVLDLWEAALNRPKGEPWLPDAGRDGFLRATLMVPAWRDALLVMAAAGKAAAVTGACTFGIVHDDGGALPPVSPPAGWPASDDDAAAGPVRCSSGPGITVPGYAEVLMGAAPDVPDWGQLDALDLVLGQLAAVGSPAAAAALTLRGWIAWTRGRGSYAAAHLSEALGIEPGYRLAELLLELVGRGAICGWAGRKDAAWQRF